MSLQQFLGDAIDNIGTALDLPGLGISEMIAGGKTTNTGRIDESGVNPGTNDPTTTQPSSISADNFNELNLGGNVLGAGTGGGASGGFSASDRAYFDDQIAALNRQQGRTETGLRDGLTNLRDSYNRNVSQQNQNRSRAMENFGMQREDTIRGKDSALDRVNTNARMLSDSLRRRIGMASGSDSSAFNITAPGAVAREASGNRTDVLGSYGKNERNLGLAEKRAETDFESLLAELASQRRTSESGLRAGILEQQNSIDAGLADASRQRAVAMGGGYNEARAASRPFQDGISARESQLDQLFSRFRTPYNVKEVNVKTPQLSDYLVDRTAINSNRQAGTQDPTAPYGNQLREEEQVSNIYG